MQRLAYSYKNPNGSVKIKLQVNAVASFLRHVVSAWHHQ